MLANVLLVQVTGTHDSLCRSFGVVLWEVRTPHNPDLLHCCYCFSVMRCAPCNGADRNF